MFTPSKYQLDIFNWIANRQGQNLVVEALAGSGKTTTGVKALELIPTTEKSIFVAFNKSIATELRSRLPNNIEVKTYHALGLSILREQNPKIQVDENKTDKILERVLSKYIYRFIYPPIKRLVSLVKGSLLPTDDDTLADTAFYYGIDVNGDSFRIFNAVREVIELSDKSLTAIDFDDMCYLPVKLGLANPTYDFLFVDELQDTNSVQTELVLSVIKPGGRVVGVGDRHQSIYAFRGADSDAMPQFINRLHADTLPLSITYRNPQSVVDLVKQKFPDFGLEARPNAPMGEVRELQYEKAINEFSAGDMILCRVNADLVRPCFDLIRSGVKAIIKGRDIGKNLTSLIKRMKANDPIELMERLNEYYTYESSKLMAAEKANALQLLTDKVDTLQALSDGCKTIDEITQKIELIFSDDTASVTFSSIHKSKGLEAENVYVLRPDLLPHPMAKKDWEKQQEYNLEYVAYTRTLNRLTIVGGL